ncbi:MAG: DUF3667 domain-containing protein [Lewinellaceae bacterium]|nr:DUF3667 domain-containing protein [Lewinellaceae bacterium]
MMTVGALLKQVWFRILHLESRSLLFLWQMFIPGYVTQEFFAGRRKRYPHPIRFFFIVWFLFLFTLNHLTDFGTGLTDGFSNTGGNQKGTKIRATVADGQKFDFYAMGKRSAEFEKMRREFDSLPPEYRTPDTRKAIDSLLRRTYGKVPKNFNDFWVVATDSVETRTPDSMSLKLGFKNMRLANSDVFLLDADAIAIKYGVNKWFDLILLKQGIKTLQNPSALMKTYLGNLAWTLLALIALMSAVLTLLYWRQGRYYVEHFLFLLNEHTSLFLLLLLLIGIDTLLPLQEFWALPVIWMVASPFFAMKRFYAQGWKSTIWKALVFSFVYLVGFIVLFAAGMLLVFVFF